MKKTLVHILACLLVILPLTLTACVTDNNSTYYPTNEEMKTNLEKNGYTVKVYDDIDNHRFFVMFSSIIAGTAIEAVKDEEYIFYLGPTASVRCDTVYYWRL